jgi:curved DNA-binding protein CbpA
MGRGNHYEALGLTPGATLEQIERAYQFFAAMYEEQAVATYSLLDPEEQREARARTRQAYEILKDEVQRQQYDALLAAAASPAAAVAPPTPAPVPRSAPARSEASIAPRLLPEPVTGASLRKAREDLGIPLQHIAAATKIGVRFLEYIEGDRHSALPALVYLRGFLQEYARFLGLEPRRTADSYLKRLPKP